MMMMPKRITVTVEDKLLEWLNQKIEDKIFHNYQHAIEYILSKTQSDEESPFRHYNVSGSGALIGDEETKRCFQIYFRPDGVWCEECEGDKCIHIRWALTQPKIQLIIREKREDGWNVPEV